MKVTWTQRERTIHTKEKTETQKCRDMETQKQSQRQRDRNRQMQRQRRRDTKTRRNREKYDKDIFIELSYTFDKDLIGRGWLLRAGLSVWLATRILLDASN